MSYIIGAHTFHLPKLPGSQLDRSRVLNETTYLDNDARECDHQDDFPCYCVPTGVVVTLRRNTPHTIQDGLYVWCDDVDCLTCIATLPF